MRFSLLLIFFLASAHIYAQQVEDWIYFKDSTVVKGLITEIKGGGVEVETAEGLQKYRLHKIAKIVKQHPELMEKKYENQTAKGSVKIGWQFSLSHLNYGVAPDTYLDGVYYKYEEDFSRTHLQFAGSIMYFPFNNFGYGIILNAQGFSYGDSEMKFRSGTGVNLQYYFCSGYTRPFIDIQAVYTFGNGDDGYIYTAGAGLNLQAGKFISIQPLIQYGRFGFNGMDSKELFVYSIGMAYFIF